VTYDAVMAVDLHAHSNFSDGSDSPTELFQLAAQKGLTSLALTDHDTLEGIEAARTAADGLGVELIPGTEISCEWQRGTMHMVVLFLEPGPGPLQDRLIGLQEARSRRNEVIVERLQDLAMDITYAEILEEAGDGSVGRPHVAAVMVRKGYAASIPAAFDAYLANGRPAYVARERLSPEEAIHLSLQSNAVPIVAHPHTLGLDTAADFAETFAMLQEWGLVGVECIYGEYPADEQASYADLARRFGFLPSGGSDYHGTYKQGLDLGTGRGWLDVHDSVLDDLRAARPGD
jgi:predicted metal-dependent phosphoesterase TrpH